MSHLLQGNTLLFLSLHLIGFLCCMVSMFGIPGQMDEENQRIRRVMKTFDLFLTLSWKGIPVLFVCAIIGFYFECDMLGYILSTISLSLGLATFLCLVTLYKIR